MLEVKDLQAYYGDSHILQGISLKVEDGGRVAVLGRNGAGKSTLFKSIMNAGPRVMGEVRWNGKELNGMPSFRRAREGMSLVPEDRRIFTHLSVMENLEIAKQANAGRKGPDAEALIKEFPMLGELRTRYGNQLSGGQQQMLAVARGMMAAPKLLLLDEPTEGLAPVIVEALAKSLVSVCESGKSGLLLAEQNIWFARQCTHYLYVLDTGRLVFEGTWASFDANADIKARYLAV